jgi:hypothetical protein
MRYAIITALLMLLLIPQAHAQELESIVAGLGVLAGEEPDYDFEEPVTLPGIVADLVAMTAPPPEPDPEATETDTEPQEIPEQFTPTSLVGTYYNAYHDGDVWRYDTLTFSDPDGECENPHVSECGDLEATGQYSYTSRWEIWEEPEGSVIAWDIPALGKQWLAICERTETTYKMLWKISKGDLVVALREFQCNQQEYFFFSETDAAAFADSGGEVLP